MTYSISYRLATGIADYLSRENPGAFHWDAGGDHQNAGDAVPVYVGRTPEAPDTLLAVTAYVVDAPAFGLATYGIQLRARSGFDPDRILDAARPLLDGVEYLELEGIPVPLLWLVSEGTIGEDQNARSESVSNYYAHVGRESAGN